jgi:hypothetical protein
MPNPNLRSFDFEPANLSFCCFSLHSGFSFYVFFGCFANQIADWSFFLLGNLLQLCRRRSFDPNCDSLQHPQIILGMTWECQGARAARKTLEVARGEVDATGVDESSKKSNTDIQRMV